MFVLERYLYLRGVCIRKVSVLEWCVCIREVSVLEVLVLEKCVY